MYKNYGEKGSGSRLMGADTLIGDDVYNNKDEDLGDIKEIMLDLNSGRIAYAVLSFGGFLGIADKLFAVPWSALKLDAANKRLLLTVEKERLESAPGFNKDDWPDMADPRWQNTINAYYGTKSYSGPTDTPDIPYEDTPTPRLIRKKTQKRRIRVLPNNLGRSMTLL